MNVKDIVTVQLIDPHTSATRRAVGYVDEVKMDSVCVVGLYLDHETPWGPPKYPPLSHRWEVSPQQCCVLAPGPDLTRVIYEDQEAKERRKHVVASLSKLKEAKKKVKKRKA